MDFLTPLDLDTAQKSYVRSRVQANAQVLDYNELQALGVVKSHLGRYDIATIFKRWREWAVNTAYVTGDKVWKLVGSTYHFYTAVQNSTGEDPEDNATYWTEGDTRHHLLVSITANITIYYLYRPVESGVAPENVQALYDDAMGMLKAIAAGKLAVHDLPLAVDPETEEAKPVIRGFSETRRTADW